MMSGQVAALHFAWRKVTQEHWELRCGALNLLLVAFARHLGQQRSLVLSRQKLFPSIYLSNYINESQKPSRVTWLLFLLHRHRRCTLRVGLCR